jgi:succinate dehydrogenase / fumarate reductase iron-sulfur subunit
MAKSRKVKFLIFRGTKEANTLKEYWIESEEGMVVLDAILDIQAKYAPDLGIRCNCKAGKCGSCSAEINGLPHLMCKTRLSQLPLKKPIVVKPLKAFPLIKDLVTDISWNYEVAKKISPFSPQSDLRFYQEEADRIQEFRKCIECFLCQATCHVIRNHDKKDSYFGPRFLVRLANLVKHPLDNQERLRQIKEEAGIAYCNVTRCCTEVCPEKIKITDNAIIPLKEMIVDKHYDPLLLLWYIIFKNK